MTQCKCKTNDGTRCKNAANPDSSHHFCTGHEKHDKMRCISLSKKSVNRSHPPAYPRAHPRKVRKSRKTSKKSVRKSKKSVRKSKKSVRK